MRSSFRAAVVFDSDHRPGVVKHWIAEAEVDRAMRLLALGTAWLMDTIGNKGARIEVSIRSPRQAGDVGDRPGDSGAAWRHLAGLRARRDVRGRAQPQIADGPDEVHRMASPGARRGARGAYRREARRSSRPSERIGPGSRATTSPAAAST
jgi:hypothetical protein